MTRSALSIITIAIISLLSACGGGGGGGGGGSSGPSLDTQASITGANYDQVAGLAVRSNLLVADSPNYNNGYPAAVIGGFQPTTVNVMNLSRVQLAEMQKSRPLNGSELPIGVRPVGDAGDSTCPLGGTMNKTYTDALGAADTDLDPVANDKLVINYTNCRVNLLQEANNCLTISEPNKEVTLNGTVTTLIASVTSVAVYAAKLSYSNLKVEAVRNNAPVSSTVNGSINIALAATSPQITLSTAGSEILRTQTGSEVEQLSNALIRYDDNQQGCGPAAPNNSYAILPGSTGRVASSLLGYVDVSVTTALTGNSASGNSGFPGAGSVRVDGSGGTNMTISALNDAGEVQLAINGTNVNCPPNVKPKWSDVFAENLRNPLGCQ